MPSTDSTRPRRRHRLTDTTDPHRVAISSSGAWRMVPASRAARLVRRLPRFLRVPTRAAGALIGGLVALLLELAALPGRAIDALTAPMVDGIEIPPCPGCDSPLCPDCRYASDLWW